MGLPDIMAVPLSDAAFMALLLHATFCNLACSVLKVVTGPLRHPMILSRFIFSLKGFICTVIIRGHLSPCVQYSSHIVFVVYSRGLQLVPGHVEGKINLFYFLKLSDSLHDICP